MHSQRPHRRTALASTALLLGYAILTLSGCNQYSENGLMGDYVAASKCPANGCANQAADPNYISLKNSVASLTMNANENRAEFFGECYPSTYPQNIINVTVKQSTGASLEVRAYNTTGTAMAVSCIKGRYNFVLSGDTIPANSVSTVRLELVGIEANGARHTNAAGGNATVTLRK